MPDNYSSFSFVIPGKPFGKQRPRMTRVGHTYTPKETTNYENLVKVLFSEKYPNHVPTDKSVVMVVEAEFPIPTSWSKKKKEKALHGYITPHKPDWDNIGKIISDALNGIAYLDDSQIYKAVVVKAYSESPKVKVFIEYEDPDDLHLDELPF